jgi:hypothetical protein
MSLINDSEQDKEGKSDSKDIWKYKGHRYSSLPADHGRNPEELLGKHNIV